VRDMLVREKTWALLNLKLPEPAEVERGWRLVRGCSVEN